VLQKILKAQELGAASPKKPIWRLTDKVTAIADTAAINNGSLSSQLSVFVVTMPPAQLLQSK